MSELKEARGHQTDTAKQQTTPASQERTPVLDRETNTFDVPKIERQMGYLTMIVAEEMRKDEALRDAIMTFAATPLTEELPNAFVEQIEATGNERIAAFLSSEGLELKPFIALPAVPEELLTPDIVNAPSYEKSGTSTWSPEGRAGVTSEERKLVGSRFVFARYVKRLALGAELLANPQLTKGNTSGRVELPSGIKVTFDPKKTNEAQSLMDPTGWKTNRQIKDRVYEVSAGNERHILKERKTNRHLHVKKNGHTDGLTTKQEYATARFFESISPITEGDVRVRFEEAVGYVEFPDGYSFTLFRNEEGLWPIGEHGTGSNRVTARFAQLIEEHPESFQQEFKEAVTEVEMIMKSKTFAGQRVQLPFRLFSKFPPLTFKQFARVQAISDMERAQALLDETQIKHGFRNTDHDGFAYKLYRGDQKRRPSLELVGFDFEYFSFNRPPEQRNQEIGRLRRFDVMGKLQMLVNHLRYYAADEEPLSPQEVIYYLAVMQKTYPEMTEIVEEMKREDPDFIFDLQYVR